MKISFIDLLFNWLPRGGADVDTFNTIQTLQKLGHEVLLITIQSPTKTRGNIDLKLIPFPIKLFRPKDWHPTTTNEIIEFISSSISEFNPQIIIFGNGFFLKPVVTMALIELKIPMIWRQYAYELLCQKDILKFVDNYPCPLDFFSTPNVCQKCFLNHQKGKIINFHYDAWLEDYLASSAYTSSYYKILQESLTKVHSIWVYSIPMYKLWKLYHNHVDIVPGGVDVNLFDTTPTYNNVDPIKKILMPGRVEDPAKGFDILYSATQRLRSKRVDFWLCCTTGWQEGYPDWVKFIHWVDYYQLPQTYSSMDICVIPSQWEEPFGLVALEAMSCGLPVIASNVGGFRNTIKHGETGFLFDPKDTNGLINLLELLLDNPQLTTELGTNAQQYVRKNFAWEHVVKTYVEPALQNVLGTS